MSRATRAVVSFQHYASTFRQTKKKALLSKTFLNFGARGGLESSIFSVACRRIIKLGIQGGIHEKFC